jgi:colicin import membrane protein
MKARQAQQAEQKKAMEEAAKERQKQIEKQRAEQLKAIEDAKREEERKAKAVRQQFEKDMGDARKAAMDFFAEKQKQQEQRRADISKGPGSGMEAGSAEAAKFAADMVNQRMGAAVAPPLPTPGEKQIVDKAAELFREQKTANAKADRQIGLLENILVQSKDNGFRRIR